MRRPKKIILVHTYVLHPISYLQSLLLDVLVSPTFIQTTPRHCLFYWMKTRERESMK